MPFSLSKTFGKKSPDFQAVNLAQKKALRADELRAAL
jgi:hypothetical protein